MATRASSLLSLLVLLALFLFPHEAHAWVETNIRSHQARIEVNRDGSAIVRHELLIKLRGGPTKAIEVGGVGNSIVPLPDALVRRAAEGSASKWPLTVSSLEDGSVRLKILNERGIRGGSYLFSFAYSIDLNELNWITPTQSGAEITWVGPRLVSGVDSAKATFVIPRGELPPPALPPLMGRAVACFWGKCDAAQKWMKLNLSVLTWLPASQQYGRYLLAVRFSIRRPLCL